jgi:hypothetical protein
LDKIRCEKIACCFKEEKSAKSAAMTLIPNVYNNPGSTGSIRQDLTSNLVGKLITQGQCLSVSAPNNFGKSYFLRQLLTTSALASHTNLLIVHIDCNLRADDSQQAFYELVLKELLATFNNQKLTALYRELVPSPSYFAYQ